MDWERESHVLFTSDSDIYNFSYVLQGLIRFNFHWCSIPSFILYGAARILQMSLVNHTQFISVIAMLFSWKKKVSLGSKMSMQSWIYHLSWQENLTKIDFFTIHLAGNIVKLSNFHHCKNRFRRGWNWRHAIHLRIFCSEKNCKLFTKVPRVKRTYAPHIRR